jgi:hypothetical protein
MPYVISQIKQHSSDMNEFILAPCDVISKIKQNSSDMNEIILAPCDAGYVQSCTGSSISPIQSTPFIEIYRLLPVILPKIERGTYHSARENNRVNVITKKPFSNKG